MRKLILGCLGVAAAAFALQATPAEVKAGVFDECTPCAVIGDCNPCDDISDCNPCDVACGTKSKWFVHGHLDSGFFANGHGQKSTYVYGGYTPLGRGADYDSGNSNLLMNTRLTGGQINQTYVSLGRSVDGKRGLDIGGTVDFTWGSDAYLVQSRGLEFGAGHGGAGEGRWGTGDYFASFAQAYAEIAYKRWNVKAGKFYAPFGSSHYKSTENFFYSWAQTAIIAPHVAGGAYATYKVNDRLSVIGGWAMPEEVGESSEYNTVLGGVVWTPTKRLNVRYVFATGENTYGLNDFDVFVHSLVATAHIGKKWSYVFDWTLLNVNYNTQVANYSQHAAAYGLNNELIYQYSKKWAFGVRFGLLNSSTPELLPGLGTTDLSAGDWYTISLGANWTPTKWLTVKPEVRYDWTDDPAQSVFNYGYPNYAGSTYQVSGGLSAVVKF